MDFEGESRRMSCLKSVEREPMSLIKTSKMTHQIWIILVCVFSLNQIGYSSEGTQEKAPKNATASEQAIQAFLREFQKNSLKIQGGAIAILHHDQVIHKSTFGHIRGKKGEITSNTLFPLASSSKPISAALVAYLVKENKLIYENDLKETF